MQKNKEQIRAIHGEDLKGVLKKIGVYDSFMEGDEKCKFCNSVVNLANLHSIFPESGDIKFVCDQEECIKKLFKYLDTKNYEG